MDYSEFDKLINIKWDKKCIFGAGKRGRGVVFKFLQNMGIAIDFYIDNNYQNIEAVNELTVYPIDKLDEVKGDCLIFISVAGKACDEIIEQLVSRGINQYIVIDDLFFSDLCISIEKTEKDYIWNRYKCLMDDEFFLMDRFLYRTGRILDLKNPNTFDEKLQYLKIHDRNPLYTLLVDKAQVKEYVSEQIGEDHVIKSLGIWDSFDDIDFNALPDRFVLKCTHDSGSIEIVTDKTNVKYGEMKERLELALSKNYYWCGSHEWPYKNVNPRIIAEPYLVDESGIELKDYKLFCFNGKVKMLQVDYDRFVGHKRNLYDVKWNRQDFTFGFPTDKNVEIKKPDELEEMIQLAEKLSVGIPHVRIDFYIIKHQIYFGEFTFYHGGGYERFSPDIWDSRFGEWIDLGLAYDNVN